MTAEKSKFTYMKIQFNTDKNIEGHERLETFLNTILTEFKDKNPEIPKNTKVLLSKIKQSTPKYS